MKKKTPKEPQMGLSLPRWFAPSPVDAPLTEKPSGASGREREEQAETSPQSQPETQRPEPSDNVPGEYCYKKTGVDKGEAMRPDLKKGKNK